MAEARRAQLARAVADNQVAWVRAQGALRSCRVLKERDPLAILGDSRDGPNHVCGFAALSDERPTEVDRLVDELLDTYRRARAAVSFWVAESSRPRDLSERLRSRGLRCLKHVPAYALSGLDSLEGPLGFQADELAIELVDDFSVFEGREHPFFGRVRASRARARRALDASSALVRGSDRATALLARWAGEPVGLATLFADAHGTLGLYDLGVVVAARGRGIGSALVRVALDQARVAHASAIVLLASGMGEGLYERLGFERVGVISRYYFSRARQARESLGFD